MSDAYGWVIGGALTAVGGALGLWVVRGLRRAFQDLLRHLAAIGRLPDAVEDLSTEVRDAKVQIESFADRLTAVENLVTDRIDNIVIIGNERQHSA